MSEQQTKPRGTFVGQVIANDMLCDEHYRLRLGLADFPPSLPGQFVQLQCSDLREHATLRQVDWSADCPPKFTQGELTARAPLLRRPFSLAHQRQTSDGVELDIIYQVIGGGTSLLAGIKPGTQLSVLGPLGNSFGISKTKPVAVLIGGGVGIPPMLCLAEALAAAGKRTFAFIGTRSARLLPLTLLGGVIVSSDGAPSLCVQEFAAAGAKTAIATDDGSLGFAGFVSDAFGGWLDSSAEDPGELVVYSCGPEAMMRSVGDKCISRGIECQLAMERHMACGMGTCQSCIVKVKDTNERGWSFKLCCTDGPIFDAGDIIW